MVIPVQMYKDTETYVTSEGFRNYVDRWVNAQIERIHNDIPFDIGEELGSLYEELLGVCERFIDYHNPIATITFMFHRDIVDDLYDEYALWKHRDRKDIYNS